MLTNLVIRNFKRFDQVEVELGDPVLFIGPNNSGKTSAMQALALWNAGLKRWNARRAGSTGPEKRPGVTVNRRDLVAVPTPAANLLWRDLHTRNVRRVDGRPRTDNIRIEISVDGVDGDGAWSCGLEFDYANEESFYCRPLRIGEGRTPERMPVPPEAGRVEVALLPPMSGLAATETRLDQGSVNVRVGEGRTAEVLRNLCFRIHDERPEQWDRLVEQIEALFGARLEEPRYIEERGEITMNYRDNGASLDLSSSGRGLQQTLLILSYMYAADPGAVLLLDEPDAHLEILRQRQIYHHIKEAAQSSGSQVIAASHSEVLLNEAAGTDVVIAFVGSPHRIDNRGSQVYKALREIGFEHYVQAEQTGWVLYLEGSTDLAILRAFADRLGHTDAARALDRPFVHYVENQMRAARNHYHGLREALTELRALVILDEPAAEQSDDYFEFLAWNRREIENYLCSRATLEAYAAATAEAESLGPLFVESEIERRMGAMTESIDEIEKAMATLGQSSPWDDSTKVSDDFLTPLFEAYYRRLSLPNLMRKTNFHVLADHVPDDEIDPEITEKLDSIAQTAAAADRR